MSLDFSGYKGELTSDNILKQITDYQIISYYLGYSPKPGTKYLSPFKKERTPSFSVFKREIWLFKDFSSGLGGDCYTFVKQLFSLNYYQVLNKINQDLNLRLGNDFDNLKPSFIQSIPLSLEDNKEKIEFIVEKRQFNLYDYDYWIQFGISRDTLSLFNVEAIREVYYRRSDFIYPILLYKYKRSSPCYIYNFYPLYKFYCPLSSSYKWFGNVTSDVIQGYEQLPETGELLILTKGLKDVMCLHDRNYHAIAPASETTNFPEDKIIELQSRFKRLVVLFDIDCAGYVYSEKLCNKYNIDRVFLQDDYCIIEKGQEKDVSDFRKNRGEIETKELCLKLFKI